MAADVHRRRPAAVLRFRGHSDRDPLGVACQAGRTETFTAQVAPGTWCYGIWALDTLGRPSTLAAKVVRTVPRT